MNLHTIVFLTNMAWLAIAAIFVALAYFETGSLHSFWFILIYWLGHTEVKFRDKSGKTK